MSTINSQTTKATQYLQKDVWQIVLSFASEHELTYEIPTLNKMFAQLCCNQLIRVRTKEFNSWQNESLHQQQRQRAHTFKRSHLSEEQRIALDGELTEALCSYDRTKLQDSPELTSSLHLNSMHDIAALCARGASCNTLSTHTHASNLSSVNFARFILLILQRHCDNDNNAIFDASMHAIRALTTSGTTWTSSTLAFRSEMPCTTLELAVDAFVSTRSANTLALLQTLAFSGLRPRPEHMWRWTNWMNELNQQCVGELCLHSYTPHQQHSLRISERKFIRMAVFHDWLDLNALVGKAQWCVFPSRVFGTSPRTDLVAAMLSVSRLRLQRLPMTPNTVEAFVQHLQENGQSLLTAFDWCMATPSRTQVLIDVITFVPWFSQWLLSMLPGLCQYLATINTSNAMKVLIALQHSTNDDTQSVNLAHVGVSSPANVTKKCNRRQRRSRKTRRKSMWKTIRTALLGR